MTRRASILTEIPFLGRSSDGAKRARINTPLDASTNRENDQRVFERVLNALRDLYKTTQSEWIRRHWHAALAHADVAAEHAAKTQQTDALLAAFQHAVDAECVQTRDALQTAATGEQLVLILRNFVFRTKKRAEAASVLDTTLFRPAKQRGLAELANEQLAAQVLTADVTDRIRERICEQFFTDFAAGVRLALAYLLLFNEPGLPLPSSGPWKPITDAVWERAIAENARVVEQTACDPQLLSNPQRICATINGWVLNVLKSGARAYRLVVLVRNRGAKHALDLNEKAWLQRLAATPAKPYAVWAEFALVAARAPLEAGATLKLLRQFYRHGNHSLWGFAEWPALFRAALARAVQSVPDVVAQHDVAWRVLAALSPGVAREHERRFRETFLREAHAVLGAKFYAGVLRMLLHHRVGEFPSAKTPQSSVCSSPLAALLRERLRPRTRPQAPLDPLNPASMPPPEPISVAELSDLDLPNAELSGSASETEARAEAYLEQTIFGDALPAVRACERLLHPMPPKTARTLLSAVLFANDLMIHDGGEYEGELYREVARCFLPAPLGEQRAVVRAQLQAFTDLTGDEFHNVVNLVNEIAAQRLPRLVLNSGNWMCARDPFLVDDLPDALQALAKTSPRDDFRDEPLNSAENAAKMVKWHLSWSTAICEWRGGQFSLSWQQLLVLKTLWESPAPVSAAQIYGEVTEFKNRLLQDLVQRSGGVVRHGTRGGEVFYAIDSEVAPTSDWAVLQFADEWE